MSNPTKFSDGSEFKRYKGRCSTCGEPYTVPPTLRARACSNGFHLCRDCKWERGKRTERCARHATPELERAEICSVPMTRVVLTANEARAAAEGTLTEIRRPFEQANDSVPPEYREQHNGKPDMADAVFPDGSGKGWIAWWGRGPFTAEETVQAYPGEQGIQPPLGQPGTVLWTAEEWGAGSRPDPFEGSVEGIEYRADEEGLDKDDLLPLRKAALPDDVDLCEYMGKGWQPADAMPQWASRTTLRITSVRVERAGEEWMWVYGVEKA